MTKLLTENNSHVFICGLTRSGKTYFAKNAVAQLKRPVIFFNVQNEQMPGRFLQVNERADFKLIKKHLAAGGKIDFRFSQACSLAQIQAIIGFVIRSLMQDHYTQQKPIYIVIDEAQLLSNKGLEAAIDASTRGLSRGVRLICISQRPALVSKTIYTQASEHYIFRLQDGEKMYMQNKGVDFEKCKQLWQQNGQYSYVFTDGFITEGRRAI